MEKIKVALIGSGQISRMSHIPAYRSMDNVEIVGVSDTNIDAARKLAEDFDIPYFTQSHKDLLEHCRPDAVSVCVPNKFHYPIVMDALEYGCNVMCEKPPAISAKEAQEMAEKAEEKGLLLTYDFHFRHGTNVSIIKEKINDGKLGKIYFTRAKWLRRAGVPGWGNFISKDIQGGGPLIDIGAHMLDLSLYLLDYPEIAYVTASCSDLIGKSRNKGLMGNWNPDRYTVEDGLFGMIYFKDGTCLELETTFALNMKEKDLRAVEIYGDKLGASLFPAEVYGGDAEDFSNTNYPFVEDGDLHTTAICNFIKACMGEEKLLVTAKQGAYIQKLVEALYTSAENKKPVLMD